LASLQVLEIFDSLQGEGYWVGTPMTFVRLAGCNALGLGLGCVAWCDTAQSWDPRAGEEADLQAVLSQVRLPRLCLTGGEPLLQPEGVAELLAAAATWGIRVHLETNGTLDPRGVVGEEDEDGCHFTWTAVSPKPPNYFIAPGWSGMIDELKLVADDVLDAARAERLAAEHPGASVFIQPESGGGSGDERVAAAEHRALERAMQLVMDHPAWRLSLQTHKILGIR